MQKKRLLCLSMVLILVVPGIPFNRIASAENLKKIILLETMPVPVVLAHSRWFVSQLGELGYQEEKNMHLVTLEANGDRSRAERLLQAAIKNGRPDIVVTNATMASQAAVKILKGTRIPILFMTVSDPVGAGLIKEIGVPTGNNLTGRVHMINRETRMNMVMRLVGDPSGTRPVRIGFIYSSYPSAMGDIRQLLLAAENRTDVEFIPFKLTYRKVPEGLPAMLDDTRRGIEALHDRVDFWWEPSGPLGELIEYTQLLLEHSTKPVIMGTKLTSVKMGALLHLTPSIEASGRETARLADAILNGADPGKIPPVPPSAFNLGINLGTALKLNLVVPPDLLKLAGEHVYR